MTTKEELDDRIKNAHATRAVEQAKQDKVEMEMTEVVLKTGSEASARSLAPDVFDRVEAGRKRLKEMDDKIDELEEQLRAAEQ